MASQANSGSDLGFEADLFKAADKLRGNLEPSEYKHVALGLIFLKYISEAFELHHAKLSQEAYADPEDPEEYLAANVFWVPPEARWAHLQANAKLPKIKFVDVNTGKEREGDIGGLIDNAMDAIEKANRAVLQDVLPKIYARPQLDKTMLGELIDEFSKVGMHSPDGKAKDLLGRAYEYFIAQFAGAEGRRGGEFFTPRSVVQTIVEMLEPHNGRVYDPCCGSGGMFVQSERFIENHQGRRSDIAIYGQERNHTTWRLCKMNLAVRGIDADIKWNNEGSFIADAFPTLKFDYAMANPPFNISDWWQPQLEGDVRWKFGQPPASNANFAWLQHIIHHLAPRGTAGVVLANGSMSSQQSDPARAAHLAALFPTAFGIDGLPVGWRLVDLQDEFNLTMGQSPPGDTYNDVGDGLPFFQGRTDFGFRYPDNRKYCSVPNRVADAHDTLISVRAPVGDLNMAWEKCCIGRGVAAARHKSGASSYTFYTMRTLQPELQIYEHTGTVFGAINRKQFEKLPVVDPGSVLVAEFEKLAGVMDQRLRAATIENRTLAETRDYLLPRLMSGAVRVAPQAEAA